MTVSVIARVAALKTTTTPDLKAMWRQLFETEPPRTDNPLLHMDNVIGTPHGLSHADESIRRCAEMTQENVLAIVDGRLPPYIVNPKVRWRLLQEA